jgi:adenylate kinase family enzyme
VVGCIGAGKSTLARLLGERLNLPAIHLDRLWWQDGDYKITGPRTVAVHALDSEAFGELQRRVVEGDRWVIDGGLEWVTIRLARADTVIFLDLPPWVCAWRVVRRTGTRRADYPPQVRESWRWMLRLVHWIVWKYPRYRRPAIKAAIAEHAHHARVVELRSPSEVAAFCDSLGGS